MTVEDSEHMDFADFDHRLLECFWMEVEKLCF